KGERNRLFLMAVENGGNKTALAQLARRARAPARACMRDQRDRFRHDQLPPAERSSAPEPRPQLGGARTGVPSWRGYYFNRGEEWQERKRDCNWQCSLGTLLSPR